MLGTAVMLAPGLAVTARHILDGYMEAISDGGDFGAFLVGIRDDETDYWAVRSVSRANGEDVDFLGIELRSKLHPSHTVPVLPATTRCPDVGEELTIMGFRFDQDSTFATAAGRVSMYGALFSAKGRVLAVYPEQRDSVMVTFPAIEIGCGSIGSMSGGAVVDAGGHVVGVISVGMGGLTDSGPTTASWLAPLLGRPVQLVWPPGAYPEEIAVADAISVLQGRDHLTVVDGTTQLSVWH